MTNDIQRIPGLDFESAKKDCEEAIRKFATDQQLQVIIDYGLIPFLIDVWQTPSTVTMRRTIEYLENSGRIKNLSDSDSLRIVRDAHE
jgi:hypothetical protein